MTTAIPSVSRLSSRIIRILGENPGPMTLQGTNTYLIGTGRRRLLLDTGDENVPQYIENLKSVLKDNIQLSHIVITHWHHDHIGGLKDILQNFNFTDCQVWKYPSSKNISNDIEIKPLKDKQEITVEGATIKVFHTPGHTDDHIILTLLEENALFSADCVLGEGTAVFEDLYDYMKSLNLIYEQQAKVIYPGHGNIIENPSGKIKYYIDHRNQREHEILNVLKKDPEKSFTEMDLVKEIYKDTPEHLWRAASFNVIQHLKKLSKENQIINLNDKWKHNNKTKL